MTANGLSVQARPKRADITNFAMLVVGFGLGQGAIFLAQTWLIAQSQINLLAAFGAHHAFAMFGVIVVETASTVTLARSVASQRANGAENDDTWRSLWATSIVRLILALAVIFVALAYVQLTPDAFSRGYVLSALPGYLLWPFSTSGLLDGLRRSGIAGLAGVFPYVLPAAALVPAASMTPADAGVWLGGAFAVGTACTIACQWIALLLLGYLPRFLRPERRLFASTLHEILGVLLGTLPGQAFYRVQILIAGIFLGSAAMALFIYAKQAINALSMLFTFVRRVEFPSLVERIAAAEMDAVAATYVSFRFGLLMSAVAAIVVCTVSLAGGHLLPQVFREALATIALLSPLVVTLAAISALAQGLFATERALDAARIVGSTSMIGAMLSVPLASIWGITGLLVAEMATHLLGVSLALPVLRSTTATSAQRPLRQRGSS